LEPGKVEILRWSKGKVVVSYTSVMAVVYKTRLEFRDEALLLDQLADDSFQPDKKITAAQNKSGLPVLHG